MEKKTIWIIVIAILLILCICCLLIGGVAVWQMDAIGEFLGLDETSEPYSNYDTNATQAPSNPSGNQSTPVPQPPSPDVSLDGQTWLVMLYQDADDNVLEEAIYFDMNEAEYSGSSHRVHVVSQFDRYIGSYDGDGDWTGAKRFYLNQDSNLNSINSPELMDLGEINMGDENVLVDFVTWAIAAYPADRHVLIMSDHGAGWFGGWSDKDNDDEDGIFMNEMDYALNEIITRSGIGKLDIIGFDACLMAQLEVFTAIAPYADYAVASEETEPSIGWAYAGFLDMLHENPSMTPREFASRMVDSYIASDQRIVNDEARIEFVEETFNYSGSTTAEEVAVEMAIDVTLSAIDLSLIPQVNQTFNQLVNQMQYIDQAGVAEARTYAQSYYSIFGPDVPASYLDLGSFIQLVEDYSNDSQITQLANDTLSAINQAVINEMHGPQRPGSTGIAIYFPNSQLYVTPYGGYDFYTRTADRFARESQWDDFLAFHYSGQSFTPDTSSAVTPPEDFELLSPGFGEISIDPITISQQSIQSGGTVSVETTVQGDNIGYIYIFAGNYYPEDNDFMPTYVDFVVSGYTQQIDGVLYPDWGGSEFVPISVNWTTVDFFISDGYTTSFAALYPLFYGASSADMVYAVDGIFTFGDSGSTTHALMTFGADGWMRDIYSYNREGGAEGPREIIAYQGDSFTPLIKLIHLPEGNETPDFEDIEGQTLTFTNSNFYWTAQNSTPGEYLVGVGATDMDGNYSFELVELEITP